MCGEGSICVRISRAVFCKMDVISEFVVAAKDCGKIFSSFIYKLGVRFLDGGCDTGHFFS